MLLNFLSWYFRELPQKIYKIWINYLWFFKNYFMLDALLKTFFSPWKGLYFKKTTPGLEIGEIVANFIFNNFSRLIGAFLRLIFILIGSLFEAVTFIFGILAFLIWFAFLPAIISGFVFGIKNLI